MIALFGEPASPALAGLGLVCLEKSIDYQAEDIAAAEVGVVRRNPLKVVPMLLDTTEPERPTAVLGLPAAGQYLDERFPGPLLQPVAVEYRVLMTQWISLLERGLGRALSERRGDPSGPNSALGEGPSLEAQLATLDKALAIHRYLAGPQLSLADLVVAPAVAAFRESEVGEGLLLGNFYWLNRWLDHLGVRPSFVAAGVTV